MAVSPGDRIGRIIILFIAICIVWGCSHVSSPVHLYTLSAMAPVDTDNMTSDLKIVVGPVRVPGYLDRPQMILRTGENQVQIVENHRWADSLEERIAWGLAENIGMLIKSDHVSIHTLEASSRPDYQVIIHFRQFDGWFGDRVRLVAYWEVLAPETPWNTRQEKTMLEEPVNGQTYQALVDALSLAVERLSRDIAKTILEMDQNNNS